MVRMPITLADLQGARYKSSLSKFKKHSLPVLGSPKLSALREAFAKALGYGTEGELRFYAKKLGDRYIGAALPVADVIDSVSKRIARQWNVTAELADTIASSLGLQHFDACRTIPRANSRNTNGYGASKPPTQVLMVEPSNFQSSEDDRAVITQTVPQSLSSHFVQADLDRFQLERDRIATTTSLKSEADRLMSTNPAQAAIDQFMKDNPALSAIDQFMTDNPAQAAIDALMKDNPTLSAIDQFMKDNPAQSAIDQFMKDNPAQAALDRLMSPNRAMAKLESMLANPAITALERLYANPQVAARWSQKGDD